MNEGIRYINLRYNTIELFNGKRYDIDVYIEELQEKNKQLQNNRNKLKNILQNIEKIIKGSLRNVGFNEDYYEYMLSEGDVEKILDMIPDFEEKEEK